MNITTNDNSLAWTLSDNTAGSGKQKRGAKVKVAQQSQDVVTSSITKYLAMMTDRDIAMMTDRDTVMAVVVAAATMIDRQRKSSSCSMGIE